MIGLIVVHVFAPIALSLVMGYIRDNFNWRYYILASMLSLGAAVLFWLGTRNMYYSPQSAGGIDTWTVPVAVASIVVIFVVRGRSYGIKILRPAVGLVVANFWLLSAVWVT